MNPVTVRYNKNKVFKAFSLDAASNDGAASASLGAFFFIQEYFFIKVCKHPNVIKIEECNITHDLAKLTFRRYHMDMGRFIEMDSANKLANGIAFIRDICAGLAYIHDLGVLHLDIKPDNILIDLAGPSAVICDFGISRVKTAYLVDPETIQTITYRAPEINEKYEQIKGNSSIDIWGLGCIMHELANGERFLFRAGKGQSRLDGIARFFQVPESYYSEGLEYDKKYDILCASWASALFENPKLPGWYNLATSVCLHPLGACRPSARRLYSIFNNGAKKQLQWPVHSLTPRILYDQLCDCLNTAQHGTRPAETLTVALSGLITDQDPTVDGGLHAIKEMIDTFAERYLGY